MIVYVENPKEFTERKKIERLRTESQDSRSTHKNQLHFYIPTINTWEMK